MRGRSSSAKSRLRSAGYKCNLCGRRLIDAATLERHQKTIHNVSPRENRVSFKTKPSLQRSKFTNKDKVKTFDNLVKEEILTVSKPKSRSSKNNNDNLRDPLTEDVADGGKTMYKNIEHVENGESLLVEKDKKSLKKDGTRRVEFECPICTKTFRVYFTAYKHMQKSHCVDADGKNVAPNSPDLVQPIRVEQCCRCDSKMRSNVPHICPKIAEESICIAAVFVCSGCQQSFISLKTFDMHVAGLHSDSVDSMFFPTKIEFMNWRLDMERHTKAKYTLYGEYDSKKIYRCNYARKDSTLDKSTSYFCPSSMVVQDFSKGIQVHFYNKHYDHAAKPYTLSSKYKKYSITSFLKNPNEETSVTSGAYSTQVDDKDLFSHFKNLMDSIVLNAADVEKSVLKTLIEKALEMSAVVTDLRGDVIPITNVNKNMSDNEISEELQTKTLSHKRRRSVDSCKTLPKPAKRTRNKSLFIQSDEKMSPKILNTFSLASNSNSDEFKSDNCDDFDVNLMRSDSNDKTGSVRSGNSSEPDTRTNKFTKLNTRMASFNESLSFNDSYKDFIDKNFIGKSEKNKDSKLTKNTVKTKLGVFKQTWPRKGDSKEDVSYDTQAVSKKVGGVTEVEEAPNVNTVGTPNVTITKVSTIRSDTPKVTNSQMNIPNKDTSKVNSKTNSRGVFSHLVDPLQVNITKVNKHDSSLAVESARRSVSKVNTRSISSPLVDPLELNVTKVRSRNTSTSLMEPLQRNISKVNARSVSVSPVDPLKVNTSKLDTSEVETPKSSMNIDSQKLNTSKGNAHKVFTNRITPKVNTVLTKPKMYRKISLEEKSICGYSNVEFLKPQVQIREMKYEVREQENDCNILVLKL